MFGRVGSTLNGGAHACIWPNVRLCQDRSARLSSLTHGEGHFEISYMLVASGLFAICNRDRCNLNYSFFGLRLCP